MGVEAAVGPHCELSLGPGAAHSPHRLAQEVGGSPSRVRPALPQPGHEHLTGTGGDGQQGVITPLSGVAVVARPLLGQPVCLADGGVQVDGRWSVAGSAPAAQARASNSRLTSSSWRTWPHRKLRRKVPRVDGALTTQADGASRPNGVQHVGVVDAVAHGQRGGHQGKHLFARVRPPRRISEVNVLVGEFTQTQVLGQRDRKDQPRIAHQAVVVEGDSMRSGSLSGSIY